MTWTSEEFERIAISRTEAVKRFREITEFENMSIWERSDMLHYLFRHGTPNYYAELREFRAEIYNNGATSISNADTFHEWRETSRLWPPHERVEGAAHTYHEQTKNHPDRTRILTDMVRLAAEARENGLHFHRQDYIREQMGQTPRSVTPERMIQQLINNAETAESTLTEETIERLLRNETIQERFEEVRTNSYGWETREVALLHRIWDDKECLAHMNERLYNDLGNYAERSGWFVPERVLV